MKTLEKKERFTVAPYVLPEKLREGSIRLFYSTCRAALRSDPRYLRSTSLYRGGSSAETRAIYVQIHGLPLVRCGFDRKGRDQGHCRRVRSCTWV